MNISLINQTELFWNDESNPTLPIQILTGLILYTLTIWTILGNIFILIAISTNKNLKKNGTSNILIGNLAFSDLLLGVTVLPFSATFSTFKVWPFGQVICDIWLSIDVLCCTASIWGLLMIAFDRYIATNHPIKYKLQIKNSKIGFAYVCISWLISSLISLGPFFFAKNETLIQVEGTNDFTCDLFRKPAFVILSSIGSFYFPLTLMIVLYTKVFMKIRSQNTFRSVTLSQRHPVERKSSDCTQASSFSGEGVRYKAQLSAETRITKVLSIIMSCFVACWLPFFVFYIIRSYYPGTPLLIESLMDFFIWLGYLNSAINPVLYLAMNKHFRQSFFSTLKLNCLSQTRSRQASYDQGNVQFSIRRTTGSRIS